MPYENTPSISGNLKIRFNIVYPSKIDPTDYNKLKDVLPKSKFPELKEDKSNKSTSPNPFLNESTSDKIETINI